MSTDDSSLAELRAATDRLSEQVAQLSSALTVVNQLQARQLEQDRELRETRETILPKDDIYERWEQETKKLAIMRRNTKRFAFLAAFIGVATAASFYVVARDAQHDATKSIQNDRHNSCIMKNQQLTTAHQAAQTFLAPFLAKEQQRAHPDPVIVGVLSLSIDSPPVLTDCSKIG